MDKEIKLNCYTLIVAVLCNCTQEQAFVKMGTSESIGRYKKWTSEDVEDIALYRSRGMTYQSIADIYSSSESKICQLYSQWKKIK